MNGRRNWVVLATMLLAMAAAAQPPVHQVADRWTAWDPPPVPEGAQAILIQEGDTLWEIAERELGDPYLWPQIWERNKYILDAEWIYPGDPLILPQTLLTTSQGVAGPSISDLPEAGLPSEEDPYRAAAGETGTERFSTQPVEISEAPVPLGYESDIYCTGYVGPRDEEFPYSIIASEYQFLNPTLDPARNLSNVQSSIWGGTNSLKLGLGLGDIVYIGGGRADGLSAGMLLTAVYADEIYDEVVHPLTNDFLGIFYHYMGRIRVLSTQEDQSIGEIVNLCDPIPVGTALKLFEPEPVPLRRLTPLRPINLPASSEEVEAGATIIAAHDRVYTLAQGQMVLIDHGWDQDVAPGDIYTVYRRGRRGIPPVVLGELGILTVYETSALGRILRSRYAMYVGDGLVLK